MEVTSTSIFEYIFYRFRRSKATSVQEKRHPEAAKAIFEMAASKPNHLPDTQYDAVAEKLGLTVPEYQHIIRKMRMLGMITKSHGKFYASRDFARFLRRMSMAMQNYCDDCGIPLKNEHGV
jgi:predicted transcriptional regulator